jgi:hypothetical protein
MKLRLQGDSVRLRLRRSEVAEFRRNGMVRNEVGFGVCGWHMN